MKYLRELAIIFSFCILGELVKLLFNLSVPSNVIGMLLLLLALCTGIVKLNMIEKTSNLLLEHLPFLFIPAGVGLITCFDTIRKNLVSFGAIIIVSTIVVIVVTGLTIELFMRRSKSEFHN
ncbi:CidA/LrgA family protein [Hathewaya massiliensis]|uniref:CidA/LrgA family protein n=1 Tax=Hathewaya massiliensis TaxID=1964382 RepID=UPI0011598D17|nr:CidA/LrgA family protein [Hathewaya massiliensis]